MLHGNVNCTFNFNMLKYKLLYYAMYLVRWTVPTIWNFWWAIITVVQLHCFKERQLQAWSKSHRRVCIMTLLHTTRYFNCGFYYYKYNSVELIFEETKLNEISKNKCFAKITRYTVCDIGNISTEPEPNNLQWSCQKTGMHYNWLMCHGITSLPILWSLGIHS